jgi:hypothetical protein
MRSARAADEDSVPELPEWERSLVIQHLQHGELRHAQPGLPEMWPYALFNGLVCASKGDHQLQSRRAIGSRASFKIR